MKTETDITTRTERKMRQIKDETETGRERQWQNETETTTKKDKVGLVGGEREVMIACRDSDKGGQTVTGKGETNSDRERRDKQKRILQYLTKIISG